MVYIIKLSPTKTLFSKVYDKIQTMNKYNIQLKDTIEKLKDLNRTTLDNDYKSLKKAFDIAYDNNIFKLYDIPKDELDNYKLEMFKAMTLISGSLSFLAIQILAADSIMQKAKYKKKESFYNKKCGIAINHLRDSKTIVSARKSNEGYNLSGKLSWASGYKIFNTLLIGFHFEGCEYEALSSFEEQKGFHIGSPEPTFVGNSLHTVNIELKDFFVPFENIVSKKDMGSYNKYKSISRTVHMCIYALGYSAIKHIKDEEFKVESSQKLDLLKEKFMTSLDMEEMDNLRVELFNQVQNIITISIVLKGGSSILSSDKLQILYKELIMFNCNGLNKKIKEKFKDNSI